MAANETGGAAGARDDMIAAFEREAPGALPRDPSSRVDSRVAREKMLAEFEGSRPASAVVDITRVGDARIKRAILAELAPDLRPRLYGRDRTYLDAAYETTIALYAEDSGVADRPTDLGMRIGILVEELLRRGNAEQR